MRRNESKLKILTALAMGPLTRAEIAEVVGIPYERLSPYLVKYRRQGLIRRERINGVNYYVLTKRGFERLQYLLKVFRENEEGE